MELQVAAALKQPGRIFDATMEQAFAPQPYGGRQIAFAEPIKLQFNYSFDGKAFTLIGQMEVVLSSLCARCAEPFIETLCIPFTERFVKGSEENEDGSYTFDGETLSLSTMVIDNLFLHLPIKSICREDCHGLCPVCGINQNQAQCTCTVEQLSEVSPLSTLGKLLNDDKEV